LSWRAAAAMMARGDRHEEPPMTHRAARPLLAALATAALGLMACAPAGSGDAAAQRLADREAIEQTLARANLGFELSDADLFANAFASDAVYELAGEGPVFGYQKMRYSGRDDISTIITDRLERARTADPATLSYDPASLRRYNRNSDSLIELLGTDEAKHVSTWLVVMKTNVDIHMSAVGRYEDELVKRDGEWLIAKRRRIE
jgi:hypothetical protein